MSIVDFSKELVCTSNPNLELIAVIPVKYANRMAGYNHAIHFRDASKGSESIAAINDSGKSYHVFDGKYQVWENVKSKKTIVKKVFRYCYKNGDIGFPYDVTQETMNRHDKIKAMTENEMIGILFTYTFDDGSVEQRYVSI